MATVFRIARCRAMAAPRSSRAGRATTRRRCTASAPTTTRTTSIACRRSSTRPARWCRSPTSTWRARWRRHHRLRHVALGAHRDTRPAEERAEARHVVLPAPRLSVLEGHFRLHRRARPRATSSIRIAMARCGRCSSWNATRSRSPSCAASSITTDCRSTAGLLTDELLEAGRTIDCLRSSVSGPERTGDRRRETGDGEFMAGKVNIIGLESTALSGREDHALRRLRPQRDHRAHHRLVLRARHSADRRHQAVGHRLLEQESRVLPEPGARLQLGARPHAVAGNRRGRSRTAR